MIKPLGIGQAFMSMVGYVTKDQGKEHYQIRLHNVNAEVYFFLLVFISYLIIIQLGLNVWQTPA